MAGPGVRRDACASTLAAGPGGEGLGNHQVDRNSRGVEPGTGLTARHVLAEAVGAHRLLDARVVGQAACVRSQVAVLGRLRQRDARSAGVQVDRLRTDQDDGTAVFAKGIQGVEQSAAR
ncbi:MAG: hypothetical protein M3445_07090, partial [Actinomycetota bacterium]|nr:hypothetical protein [Actinomycetota bacterium]